MWCDFTGRRGWKKQCKKWLLKTGRPLGCSSQQLLPPSSWLFSKCWFSLTCLSPLLSSHCSTPSLSFRSSFIPSSITLPLGEALQSSCLDPLLFLFYSLLRRGSGREDLPACIRTSDLLSDLLKNKIIACLSRKDWICMKENVICLVCREENIGVCNLVNGRKVENCVNINPSWLSNINRPHFKLA